MLDTLGLGRRLSAELEERGMDLRTFHQEVSGASSEARGSSYGSVFSYVKGKISEEAVRPNIVQAMATVLGVRFEWLMNGKGPRTPQDAAREELWEEGEDQELETKVKALALLRELRGNLPFHDDYLPMEALLAFESVAFEFMGAAGIPGDDLTTAMDLMERLAWLWMLPHHAFQFGRAMTPKESRNYFFAMAQVMATVIPQPDQVDLGRSLKEMEKVEGALRGQVVQTPGGYRLDGGVWWGGPYCPSEEKHRSPPVEPVAMERKGDRLICPECGHSVPLPNLEARPAVEDPE